MIFNHLKLWVAVAKHNFQVGGNLNAITYKGLKIESDECNMVDNQTVCCKNAQNRQYVPVFKLHAYSFKQSYGSISCQTYRIVSAHSEIVSTQRKLGTIIHQKLDYVGRWIELPGRK